MLAGMVILSFYGRWYCLEPYHDFLHLFVDASFLTNLLPMGPLFHACSCVRSGLGLSTAEVGLALAL